MRYRLYYSTYNFFVNRKNKFLISPTCIFFRLSVCYGGRAHSPSQRSVYSVNSRQLQSAVLLSQMRSFSQVAEKLGISQPALSKQIMHLESELDLKLFDRNTTPLSLTPAGEHFIRGAQDLLYREDQLLRSMEQFRTGEAGRLTIGISPFRSLYMLPELVRKLTERYPGVQVTLHEAGSDTLRAEAAEGKYDFAVVNLPVDESVLDVIPLEMDTLVLAVPRALLHLLPPVQSEALPVIDLKDCQALPFVVVGPTQEMRILFDKLCTRSGITPRIAMEVVGVTTAFSMAQSGIGATLLPLQFVNTRAFDQCLQLFTVRDNT